MINKTGEILILELKVFKIQQEIMEAVGCGLCDSVYEDGQIKEVISNVNLLARELEESLRELRKMIKDKIIQTEV